MVKSAIFLCLLTVCVAQGQLTDFRHERGQELITSIMMIYLSKYQNCVDTPIKENRFDVDNLYRYANSPSRTTVGFGIRYTDNRKYFANLLATSQFREMLAKDQRVLTKSLQQKMKYCDRVVLDRKTLNMYHDKDVA